MSNQAKAMVVYTNLSHNPGHGMVVHTGGNVYVEDCQVTRNGQYAIYCGEDGEGDGMVVEGRNGVDALTVIAVAHCEVDI